MKLLTLIATQANAQIAGDKGLLTGVSCVSNGNCTLCDIILVVNNVIKFILGISGGVLLLMIAYAGFSLMFPDIIDEKGKSAKLKKAQAIIRTSVIGIILIFFSYAIVNFGLHVLNGSVNFSQPATLFGGQEWSQLCAEPTPPQTNK